MKEVDGKGMFAEAVTQLDAQKDSAALLKKALVELPTLLTAEIEGKADFDKVKSEIVANVLIQVDRKAYLAYAKRLEDVLDKVAVSKDSTLLKAEPSEDPLYRGGFFNQNHAALGGPKLKSSSQWCIWVNNFNNATHNSLKWNAYVVDSDPSEIVAMLEVPTARGTDLMLHAKYGSQELKVTRPSAATTLIRVSALDEDGNLVLEDEEELVSSSESTNGYSYWFGGRLPLLRHLSVRSLAGEGRQSNYGSVAMYLKPPFGQRDANASVNLYVSPYSLAVKHTGSHWSVGYYPQIRTTIHLKATLEELKQIKQIKCEVVYQPDTAAESGKE